MRYHKPDYPLIITVIALVIFGLIILSSASTILSYQMFGTNYYYFLRQLLFGGLLGIIGFVIFSKIDYHYWRRFALPFLIITIILLILVFIPQLSLNYGGARRWIHLGPITAQPAEIAKLTFILYLASWLDKRRRGLANFQTSFIPFISLLCLIGILIILQPDFGTLTIIIFSAIVVYFIAGASLKHLGILITGGIILFFILILITPYRMARFTVFLNPKNDPQGIGYQINQALLAIGSGGIFGRGLGKSIEKYNYLPEAAGDSIFAVAAEELGLLGMIILISLFVFLTYRGFRIAKSAPDLFGKLITSGIISWIILQTLINIMGMTALVPLTGVPLPFISYGGTALLSTLLGMGIVVNVSRQTR